MQKLLFFILGLSSSQNKKRKRTITFSLERMHFFLKPSEVAHYICGEQTIYFKYSNIIYTCAYTKLTQCNQMLIKLVDIKMNIKLGAIFEEEKTHENEIWELQLRFAAPGDFLLLFYGKKSSLNIKIKYNLAAEWVNDDNFIFSGLLPFSLHLNMSEISLHIKLYINIKITENWKNISV